ncbi:hypothetical protein ACQZV8_02910 [Magnetococcales bacterium HHB-1]
MDNPSSLEQAPKRRRRQRRRKTYGPCVACKKVASFAWVCRKCGMTMCQDCMQENLWGMTCNQITWICSDCGWENNFGTR